jgi:hypothetical protein
MVTPQFCAGICIVAFCGYNSDVITARLVEDRGQVRVCYGSGLGKSRSYGSCSMYTAS